MTEAQNVTLTTLVPTLAEQTGQSRTVVGEVVKAFLTSVVDAVVAGQTVRISGLGTFESAETKEKEGRNPSTGQPMTIAASKRVSFKAAKPFKDVVKATVTG